MATSKKQITIDLDEERSKNRMAAVLKVMIEARRELFAGEASVVLTAEKEILLFGARCHQEGYLDALQWVSRMQAQVARESRGL